MNQATSLREKASRIKFLALDVDGTMTDGGVYVLEDGTQFKKFDVKDGLGIRLAIEKGINVGIISHSLVSNMVSSRANMLGIKHIYVGQEPKITILHRWLSELNVSTEEVAFIGDDVNDLEIMQVVGLAACPADAMPSIKKIAHVTLSKSGGQGAVREFIERFIL